MPKRIALSLRLLLVGLLAASTIFAGSVLQASPANWWHQLDAVDSETILTHPNGSVSIGQVAGNGPSAIQTVTQDIAVTKVPTSGSPLASPNTYSWVAGADNTIYTPAITFVGYYVQTYLAAYQNGTMLWSVLPPDTCAGQIETIRALRQGADGNIYIVSSRQSGCTGQEFFLSGINAQNGSTLFSVSLGGSLSLGPANFFAYTSGVALLSLSPPRLRYYNYQGALQSDTSLALVAGEFMSAPTASHDGLLYVPISKDRAATGGCPWTNVTDRVEAYGPTGVIRDDNQQPITFTVEPCANIYAQATPDGLAMIVRTYGMDDRLLTADTSLRVNWYRVFDTGTIAGREFPGWLGHDFVVDNNGNIVTISRYFTQNQQRRGVQIGVVDGSTGERTSVLHTDQLEQTSSSFALTSNGVGLAQGTLYLAAHVCDSYQCDGSHPFKLYSVPAAGLGMDYPRGRLAGQSPTPQTQLTYVSMGDSYSAGYGIQPYGSNGCHRSDLAYAKSLDETPGLNLKLQEFVACTGATTADVENGKAGDPSQLNALGTDTDIVTITIGGNDVGFIDFATACVQSDCSDSQPYHSALSKIQNDLPGSLDHLFGQIAARIGPNTRVLVLGYPRLMPYDDGTFPNCFVLSRDERIVAQEVTQNLNSAISSAVGRASSQFEFVDADINLYGVRTSPFAGHELCNDDGAYFFGVNLLVPDTSYHPNRKGAEAYAELVQKYLVTHP